jgi:hypothetical protein
MIATLSSFASQFDPALIQKARVLFDSSAVTSLKKNGLVWHAEIPDGKNYKVSVRAEDGYVTDVFCTCRPGVCQHSAAVMFALQKKLKIKTEAFNPGMLEEDPIYLLGPRINDLVYISRQPGSKNGELEKLGASISLRNPDIVKMRSMVRSQLTGYDNSPIFTGAKKLLGAAILAYEEENYEPVFTVARAILTEICTLDMMSNSANECCRAAAALLEELYNSPRISRKLKDEIFDFVVVAWDARLYAYFQKELIPVITLTLQKKEHQETALKKLEHLTPEYKADIAIPDAKMRLLALLGKTEEAKLVRYDNLHLYRKELIEEAFAHKNYEEAKKLARDATQHASPSQWWEWIGKIALIENDVSGLRDYYIYKYYQEGYHKKFYDAVRDTYSPEEWTEIYPGWIDKFEKYHSISEVEVYALAHIYISEGLADQLALHLERFPWYNLASVAQPVLEKKYPYLLKKIMLDHFVQMSSYSFTRERTTLLRQEMKHCLRTAWGKKFVSELRPHLLQLHPTWKVFREELCKRL